MKMGEETNIAEPMTSEDVVAAEHVAANGPSKDHPRKRKKHLYKSLQDLMEFYLGDVNLSKDRFMAQHIQGQPFVYVDLSLFLTFNKVKALTSNVEDLANALSQSEILQVSDDGTQVCRKTPIKKKENEDDCTIYVEQLGQNMDHDFLVKLFSEFGPVDYVSIPRFPNNGKFKGFAFVEFKDSQTAKAALEAFNAKGCCLSPHMAPEELMSIKNFDTNKENRGEVEVKNKDVPTSKSEEPLSDLDKKEEDISTEVKQKSVDPIEDRYAKRLKRKRKYKELNQQKIAKLKEIESQIKCEKQRKKNKNIEKNDEGSADILKGPQEENNKNGNSVSDDKSLNKKASTKKRGKVNLHEKYSSEQSAVHQNQEKEGVNTKVKLKRRRRRKKRKFEDVVTNKSLSEESHEDSSEPAKKKLKLNMEDTTEAKDPEVEVAVEEANTVNKKKKRKQRKHKKEKKSAVSSGLKVLPKKEWKQLRNKYLNMQRDMMRNLKLHLSCSIKSPTAENMEEALIIPEDIFKSGTILKVILEEPVTNTKVSKGDMRVHPEIRYIDVTEDSPVVYLRTSTPEVASSLITSQHWPNMQLLQGNEETEYWNKMKKDREEHFNKSKPNQRGRTKLLKRAERFRGKLAI